MALFATTSVFAQQGLEVTLGFTPGASLYYNNEDFAAGDDLNFQATYALHTGLTVGYNFSDRVGIATGIGYASLSQNYVTAYDNVDKADQSRWTRTQNYVRVPLLLRIGGDNTSGSSAFFRFGPHIDFLTSAATVNRGTIDNPKSNSDNLRSSNSELVSTTAFGVSAEIGGRIRISDQMGIFVALHLETTLTNVDGKDATDNRYIPLLNDRGFRTTSSILNPERSSTGILMGGLTVGFQYVLSFD